MNRSLRWFALSAGLVSELILQVKTTTNITSTNNSTDEINDTGNASNGGTPN